MSGDEPKHGVTRRIYVLFLSSLIALAGVGYILGINVLEPQADPATGADLVPHEATAGLQPSAAMPAVNYASMRRRESGPTSHWKPSLEQIPQPKFDLFAEIKPSEAEKLQSTLTRASRRAFNGAPPIIPHAIENTADAACYACHGMGMRIEDRVANRMSHQFLANCTQCHGAPPPKPFANVNPAVDNAFAGLPAPLKGERAFTGAPPTIPHSTWMRDQCLACHGNQAGWSGLQSTHPWRINCQQCHAPSAELEQGIAAEAGFVAFPATNAN